MGIRFETQKGIIEGQLSAIGKTQVENIQWTIANHYGITPRDVLVYASCEEYATICDFTPRKFYL